MDIKYAIPTLRYFLNNENQEGVNLILKYINQKQLAEVSGIKYRRLLRVLRNGPKMTIGESYQLAKALGTSQSHISRCIIRR
jgi:hypothetical protein